MNTLKINNLFFAIFITYNLFPLSFIYFHNYFYLFALISTILFIINFIIYPKYIKNNLSKLAKKNIDEFSFKKNVIHLSLFLFVFFTFIWIYFFNNLGLHKRAIGFVNFYNDLKLIDNIFLQLSYSFSIILLSLSFHIKKYHIIFAILGIGLLSYFFSATGTRWILLLTASPLIIIAISTYDLKKIVLSLIVLFVISTLFILLRNDLDFYYLYKIINLNYIGKHLWLDFTSIASLDLIKTYQLKLQFLNINDFNMFLMKNLDALLPGNIFNDLIDSPYIKEYNVNEIQSFHGDGASERYNNGLSNYQFGLNLFPYVYGGILPFFIIVILLNHFLFIFSVKYLRNNNYFNLALLSSYFSGCILQLRNPEITYMIPFLIIFFIYLVKSIIFRNNND